MVGVSFQTLLSYGAAITPVTSVAFHDSAVASGTADLTVPATVIAGDVLALKENSNAGTLAPSGFAILASTTGIVLSYKIATGSDASTVIPGGATLGTNTRRELLVFRGDVAANSVTGHSPAAENQATAAPSPQTVTSGSGTPPLVVVASYNSTGAIDPRGFSPAKDGEATSATNSYFAYKIYNSSPSNVDVSMDDEGSSNKLASAYIQIT